MTRNLGWIREICGDRTHYSIDISCDRFTTQDLMMIGFRGKFIEC